MTDKATTDRKAEIRKMLDARVEEAKGSPADTAIRLVFKHAEPGSIRDIMEGDEFATVEDALRYWHSVDEMRIAFRLPGLSARSWILLIHQDPHPTAEDISDYTTNLEGTPIAPAFKEANYRVQSSIVFTGEV